MIQRHMLLGGAVLWMTACGTPAQRQVLLEMEKDIYAPGAVMGIRLSNLSSQSVGINACLLDLQRHEGNSWISIPDPPETLCAGRREQLGPGLSVTIHDYRPRRSSLEPGQYRYVGDVYWDEERESVVCDTFLVQ